MLIFSQYQLQHNYPIVNQFTIHFYMRNNIYLCSSSITACGTRANIVVGAEQERNNAGLRWRRRQTDAGTPPWRIKWECLRFGVHDYLRGAKSPKASPYVPS